MIAAVSHGRAYSSSINIFAVIAGILLIRGSLRPVRDVRAAAGLFIGLSIGGLVYEGMTTPGALVLVEIRLHQYGGIVSLAMAGVVALLAVWVFQQLNSPQINAELAQEYGEPKWWQRSWISLAGGAMVTLVMFVSIALDRPNFEIALEAAKHRLGPSYQYTASGYNRVNQFLTVYVTAFNQREIRHVSVLVEHHSVQRLQEEK